MISAMNTHQLKAILGAGLAALVLTMTASAEPAQGRVIESADGFSVLSTRERVEPENRMVRERLETLLPRLMAETDLDMWLVINREYAEDPVYFTLVPQPSFAARRTTMLVFHRKADGTVDRLSVNRYPLGEPYQSAWAGGDLDAQWKAPGALILSRNPQRIGNNYSPPCPVAAWLNATSAPPPSPTAPSSSPVQTKREISMRAPAPIRDVAEAAGVTGQTQTRTPHARMRMQNHQALPSRLWAGPPSLAAVLVEAAVAEPP